MEHWTALAIRGQMGAPEPPEYRGCIKHLISAGDATSTTEELKRICREKYEVFQYAALASLMYSQWLKGAAREEGLRVSERQLQQETTLTGPHGKAVRQTLASTGETISDLRLSLTRDALVAQLHRRLEGRVPVLTNPRVAAYYRFHKDKFTMPERRDLYVVRLGSLQAVAKSKRELARGVSFSRIFKNATLAPPEHDQSGFTIGQPEYGHNGLVLGLGPHNWPEGPLSRAIFRAPLKTLQGPVHTSLGYYIFEVVKKTPARRKSLAEARSEATAELRKLLREQILTRYSRDVKEKWAAKTKCLPSALLSQCRRAISSPTILEEILNAP